MEDNKFDPILGNAEENNEAQEAATEEVVDETVEEIVDETVDETEIAEESEENSEEEVSEDEPAEAEEKPKKKKKIGKIIAISVLSVLVLLVGVVFLVGYLSIPRVDVDDIVLSVDDVDSNVGEFINVYGAYSYYASYYGFSADDVKQYAIDELTAVNSYYSKAMADDYTLTDEEKAEIDANIESLTTAAEGYGMTAEEYLEENICKGYTIEAYRAYLEKQFIAQKYYSEVTASMMDDYKGEDAAAKVQAKYEADKASYDLSDVSYWYFDSTDENAKTQADDVVAKVNGGMDFTEAIVAVTGNEDAVPNSLDGREKSVISSNFSSDAAEWIFKIENGEYVNGTGAVTTVEADKLIYVLYVDNAPSRDEDIPVTVDYIKVEVSTDTSVKTADELKLAAKATATEILNEFEKGEKTAEAFSTLKTSYTESDSLVSANTFAEITVGDSNDDAVDAWAFDDARKVGDYALVESDGCYYILFFTSVDEHAVWYQRALDSILEEKYNEWDAQIKDEFADKTTVNDDVIAECVEYLTAQS